MRNYTAALRMVRTDEAKKPRKAYEAHEIHHGFNEHRVAETRTAGCINTLSTVQKDNLLLEVRYEQEGLASSGSLQSNRLDTRANY